MKLISELYSDAMSMWSKHHNEIMQHLSEVMQAAAGAASPAAGVGVMVAEDVLKALMNRVGELEKKMASMPQSVTVTNASPVVNPVLPQS